MCEAGRRPSLLRSASVKQVRKVVLPAYFRADGSMRRSSRPALSIGIEPSETDRQARSVAVARIGEFQREFRERVA
jgi:hypothetical protein